MPAMITNRVLCLPNDMYVVMTAAGDVLVNSPPESLKFLLAHGLTPPRYVVLPPDALPGSEPGSRGFVYRGINYASVEFLIYASFFGQQQKITLITPTIAQARRLHALLKLSTAQQRLKSGPTHGSSVNVLRSPSFLP